MADIADDADRLLAAELHFAFNSRKRQALPLTGECHYCEGDVPAGHLFCDKECAEAWEHLQQSHTRAGRPAYTSATC